MSETPDYIRRTPTDADMAAAEADLMESPEFLRSEIERLRSALAARTEECARVADERAHHWDKAQNTGEDDLDELKFQTRWSEAYHIASAIRALPSTEGHSQ